MNRGMVPGDRNSAADLNHAVPVTNILDVTAARDRAELARQGSLAERSLPSSLAAHRQNSNPSDPGVASGGSTSHSQVYLNALHRQKELYLNINLVTMIFFLRYLLN